MRFGHYSKKGNTHTYTSTEIGGRPGAVISMVISIPIILIGIIFLVFTLLSYYQDFNNRNYIETDATITEVWMDKDVKKYISNEVTNHLEKVEHYEAIKYKITYTVDNTIYNYDNIISSMLPNINENDKELSVGDTIRIRYAPNNPNKIDYFFNKISWTPLFMAIFILFSG